MSAVTITPDVSAAPPVTITPDATPRPSLGRDMFGEIPNNPITRIGHRIKENLDLPKQVGRAADAINEGIQNIRTGGPSKMPEFLDALKQSVTQYQDPEKLAADLITGYITAGAPDVSVPKLGSPKPPPWWKSTEVAGAGEGPAGGALPTAIKVGKMIPGVSHYAHLADFARKLIQGAGEEGAPAPETAPPGPTGPPAEWGNRIPGEIPQTSQSIREGLTRANTNQPLQALRQSTNDLIDQHISPKADPVKNFQTKHNVEVALSQGDVAGAEAALKQATAPERRLSTASYSGPERRAAPELGFLTAKPINPENIGFDWAPPEDLGNKVRPGVEQKLGPIKRSAAASSSFPPEAPRVVPSVQNIRENLAQTKAAEAQATPRTPADLAEDRALQQEMNWDLERHGWKAESEARREFIARNSTGVTKGELTGAEKSPAGVSRSAGPVPSGTEIPTEATQMDLLQRSLRAVKAGKSLQDFSIETEATPDTATTGVTDKQATNKLFAAYQKISGIPMKGGWEYKQGQLGTVRDFTNNPLLTEKWGDIPVHIGHNLPENVEAAGNGPNPRLGTNGSIEINLNSKPIRDKLMVTRPEDFEGLLAHELAHIERARLGRDFSYAEPYSQRIHEQSANRFRDFVSGKKTLKDLQ